MKRLILFLLLISCSAWGGEPIEIARMNPYIAGSGVASAAAPAACSIDSPAANNDQTFGSDATNHTDRWLATEFTTSSSCTLNSVTLRYHKVAGTDRNINVYIYSDSTGPSSSLYTSSTTINTNTDVASTSYPGEEEVFSFSPTTLDASTKYWIVMTIDGTDGTSYARTMKTTDSGKITYRSADGSSWTALSSNTDFVYKVD